MDRKSIEIVDTYKPIIIENVQIDGITMENIPAGSTGQIAIKMSISSYEALFEKIANEFIGIFLKENFSENLNTILIHITSDKKAKVYRTFPLALNVRLNTSKRAGTVIFKNEILDIETINFRDSFSELKFSKGDQIIYLFRVNWAFGFYFNLSKQNEFTEISYEIGNFYRKLSFYSIYSNLESQVTFQKLLQKGWFPFFSIIHNHLDKLFENIDNPNDHHVSIEMIEKHFDDKKLESMITNWFKNPILKNKEIIIRAAISSYLSHTQEGYINCIKNLSTEIEGIIRIIYTDEKGKAPTTKEMMSFISDKGMHKFNSDGSLGFPGLFYEYLKEVLFKGFDLTTGDIPGSRHSVAHGVAKAESYTLEKALQLILTLDQIYFFL